MYILRIVEMEKSPLSLYQQRWIPIETIEEAEEKAKEYCIAMKSDVQIYSLVREFGVGAVEKEINSTADKKDVYSRIIEQEDYGIERAIEAMKAKENFVIVEAERSEEKGKYTSWDNLS